MIQAWQRMHTSPAGIALICGFEGCCLTAYADASPRKIATIGYGHTGAGVMLGQTITRERAEQLLASDLLMTEEAVLRAVHVPLSQCQFDALVSFAFNVRGWRESTLLRLLNSGDYAGAAAEFPRWDHAGAEVLPGLTARRAAEQAMFMSGSVSAERPTPST